nr:MAG TPA: hypothetical protein [Caudoviricetes sp.]
MFYFCIKILVVRENLWEHVKVFPKKLLYIERNL